MSARLSYPPVRRSARALALMLALSAPVVAGPAQAQTFTPEPSATILADHVAVSGNNVLTASGQVEMFYEGRRLTARGLRYDQSTGQVTLSGPIRLTEPGEEGSVILADQAELSRDLQNGILTGARLVLARELQLAAQKITRTDGHLTRFDNVVASSCQVCVLHPVPIWDIRAKEITHDSNTKRLRFRNAQLRAFGVPIAALPRLSLPDPTVTRAAGILRPRIRSNSRLGVGIELPWFQPIGDHHDLTITPLVTSKNSRSLGLAGRHALRSGKLSWSGQGTRDRLIPDKTRGYLFAQGSFALPRHYRLGMQLQATSDDSYLSDYAITDADRLWSGVTLDRVRKDKMVVGSLGYFHSLRAGENNSTSPSWVSTLTWTRRFRPALLGGEAGLTFDATAFRRSSSAPVVGRDMARAGISADWRRNWLLPHGLLASAEMGLALDHYLIGDDPTLPDSVTRVDPTAALELRWPLVRNSGGATHVLEPVMRLDLSRNNLKDVPNEDSRLAEFDESNLFAPSRFAGEDRRETGLRLAVGASWTRMDPAGWSLGVTAGRIWRAENPLESSAGGLSAGRRSDWLMAVHYGDDDGLRISTRALIDDKLRIRRNETRLAWQNARTDLSVAYLWIKADPTEGRTTDLSELMLDSRFDLGRGWSGGVNMRYDATAKHAARVGGTLTYTNECVSVDLSLSRKRTSSSTVSGETNIGLSVRLAGFGRSPGESRIARPQPRCMR